MARSRSTCSPHSTHSALWPAIRLSALTSFVSHDAREHPPDRPIDKIVVGVEFEADFEIFDAGIVLETVLDEFVDCTRTEPRQPRDFVDDYAVDVTRFDVIPEAVVLLATLERCPADDVWIQFD